MEACIWYGMFALSGLFAIANVTACQNGFFAAAAGLVGAWAAREYLHMGDEARYF